jgi:hypothetical protein
MGHRRFGWLRLVRCQHGVVELLEKRVVFFFTVGGCEAERFDAFDEDFCGVGLGFDDVNDFVEEFFERHGAWIGGLLAAHEFSLDVGWGEFDDFDVGGFQLVAERLGPGMDGGFGGAVGWR